MKTIIDELGKVSVTVEKEPWNDTKDYDKLTIVYHNFGTHISRKPVPAGKQLSDKEYWIPFSSLQEEVKVQFANLINTDEKHTNDINKLKIAVDNLTTAVNNLNIDIDITTLNTIKNQLAEHLAEYDSLNKDYQQYKEYATAEHAHINEKLEGIDEVKNVVNKFPGGFISSLESGFVSNNNSVKLVYKYHVLDQGTSDTYVKYIPVVSDVRAGIMTAADKTKLDSLTTDQTVLQNSIKSIFHQGTADNRGVYLRFTRNDNTMGEFKIPPVKSNSAGVVSPEQFNKIPWITDGKIPTTYLPDHLDDIIEYDTKEDFPEEGKKGVLYVALDTNHFYRWSGSSYIDMSDVNPTVITFGEEKGTAYEGDKGKKNADDIAEINNTITSINDTRVITSIDNRIVNTDSIVLPITSKQINGSNIATNNITFPAATTERSGVLTPADKIKINKIPDNIINEIRIAHNENNAVFECSKNNSPLNIPLNPATTTTAGVMTAADKVKLNNLVANSKTVEHFNIHVNTNNWSGFIEGNSGNKIAIGNTFRLIKSDTSPSNNGSLGYLLDTEYIISHYEGTSMSGVIFAVGTCGQIELVVNDKATGDISEIRVDRSSDGHQYDVAKVLSTNDYTNDDKNTITNLSNSLVKDITNSFSRIGGTLGFKVLTPNNGAYTDLKFIIPLASNAGNNGSGLISNIQYQKLESIPDVNTIVTTDSNGKIPNDLLPSYVSDILEYSNKDAFPTTGTTGKIYVDIATNKTYRWSGTQYTLIGDGTGISVTGKLINGTHGTTEYGRNLGTIKIPIKDASTSTESIFTIPLKVADETYAGLFAANDKRKLNGIIKNTHTLNGSIDNEHGATFTWQEQVSGESNNWQATSNQFNIPIVSDTKAGLVTKDILNSIGNGIRTTNLELIDDFEGHITNKSTDFDASLGEFVNVIVFNPDGEVIDNHQYTGTYQVVDNNVTTNKTTIKLYKYDKILDISKINDVVTITHSVINNNKTVNASLDYNSQEYSVLWNIDDTISVGDRLHITSCSSNLLKGILANADIQIIGEYKSNSTTEYIGIAYVYVSNPYAQHIYLIYGILNYSIAQNSAFIDLLNVNSLTTANSYYNNINIDGSNDIVGNTTLSISDNKIKIYGYLLDCIKNNLTYNSYFDNQVGACLVTPRLINKIIKLAQDTKTKLNNFLTNTDATDETISSWAEIQNFLDGIKDTDTLTEIKTSILNDAKEYVDNKNFVISSSLTKSSVGLGNVDNTSDLAKPVSTATQSALNNKVDKVAGKGLSTNDFTNALKTKLEGLSSSGSGNNYYLANIVDNKLVIGENDIKNIINNGDAFCIEDEKIVSDTNVFQSKWIVVSIEGDSVDFYSIVALGNRGELLYNVTGGIPTWTIDPSVRKVPGKGLSSNDYTNADKGIITSLTEVGEISNGVRNITTLADKISINNTIYNFSDNDYNISSVDIPAASTTKAGVMTADDKSKLDNLGNVKALTTAQYNALTTKDSNTIYFLTD